MSEIVERLRGTLTGHATDDEMWERVIREREEAAAIITRLTEEVERLREALEWYRVNAEGCRKVTSEGNEARRNLDKDGGKRARAALTAPAKETDNG